MEIRAATAALMSRFEMRLSPNWLPEEWARNLKDFYVLMKGEMMVDLRVRSGKE